MTDHPAIKARLEARLAELAAVADVATDASQPVTLDQPAVGRLSRMDALQQQAMAQDQVRRQQREQQRIRRALARLAGNSADAAWGECLDCGEAIAPARLDFDPACEYCLACASARED